LIRFTIALQENDLIQAQLFLRDLVNQPTISYDGALAATKKWIDRISLSYKDASSHISEIFKILAGKYPK
jgi:hypothetical protein